jgi:hypothetical protein
MTEEPPKEASRLDYGHHVLRVDGGRKVMAQGGVSAPVYGVPF